MSNGKRFIVIEKSLSAHCCFTHSVIDTSEGKELEGTEFEGWKKAICETMDAGDAECICDALNECITPDPEPIINTTENIQQTLNVITTKKIIDNEL